MIEQLTHTYAIRTARYREFEPALQVYMGIEDASPGYEWDGLKRSADPEHPFVVFQYTLDGWGYYEDGAGRIKCSSQTLFTALVPSAHRYYRPQASSRWLVLWGVIHHPYIVQRIVQRQKKSGVLLPLELGHPLLLKLIDLFEGHCRGTTYDILTHEQTLFALLWEYERVALRLYTDQPQRERLREEVRQHIMQEIHRSIDVAELAERHSMSRSHFSHYFRAISGVSPAHYVQRVRLEEAVRRLLHTGETIEQIAGSTGFATATHFCRVFRQRFHLSPGEFRRQMR